MTFDNMYLYVLPGCPYCAKVDRFLNKHDIEMEHRSVTEGNNAQELEALGGKVPTFAHLPLLTGKEGKLSKRLGSLGVRELRAQGVENMAICSYLAKLGTSEDIRSFYDLEELAQTLDFSKIGHAQPKFDVEDLKRFNLKHIHNMPFKNVQNRIDVNEDFWNKVKANLETVDDAVFWNAVCNGEITPIIENKALTDVAAEILPEGKFDENTFSLFINEVKEKTGLKGKDLFHPIRLALTGQDSGPELKILLPLIGRNKAFKRLKGEKA